MRRFLFSILGLVLVHITGVKVAAQDRGTLSVTATVVTSVALVTDANGIPRIVIANPPARNDNVSSVSFAPTTFLTGERWANSHTIEVRKIGKGKRAILPGHPDRHHEGSSVPTVSSPSL